MTYQTNNHLKSSKNRPKKEHQDDILIIESSSKHTLLNSLMIKTQIQCEISIPPSQGTKRIGAEIRELTLAKNPRLWVMLVFPCHPWNWRVCKDNNNDRAGNLLLFAPFFILILQARWKKDHPGGQTCEKILCNLAPVSIEIAETIPIFVRFRRSSFDCIFLFHPFVM